MLVFGAHTLSNGVLICYLDTNLFVNMSNAMVPKHHYLCGGLGPQSPLFVVVVSAQTTTLKSFVLGPIALDIYTQVCVQTISTQL